MLRVAVVGAGNHSMLHHGPSLRDCSCNLPGGIELAAVCDLDRAAADRYAKAFRFKSTHTSYREMLSKESIDAIIAVTPVHVTKRVVGDLLPYQLPILMEKPPGVDSTEAEELLDLAERYRTPTMVSCNRRFVPALQRAAEWIDRLESDRKPRLLIARMLRDGRGESDFIVGTAFHLIDTALSFMGVPTSITSKRQRGADTGAACEAQVTFAGDKTAILVIEPVSGVDEESYDLIGPGFTVQVDSERNNVAIYDNGRCILQWTSSPGTPIHEMS